MEANKRARVRATMANQVSPLVAHVYEVTRVLLPLHASPRSFH